MSDTFEELNAPGCPKRGRVASDRLLVWFGALMLACVLVLLAIMIKWVGAPGIGPQAGEDGREIFPAAAQTAMPAPGPAPGGDPIISFPAGIGNEQMQLIAQGGPYLGLSLSDLPAQTAAGLGLAAGRGALVNIVVAGSPGAAAGIKAGDVLLRLDNADLAGPAEVGRILGGKRAGETVKAVYSRAGVQKSTHITLENAPLGLDVGVIQKTPWVGLDVQDVDAIMRIQFNLPDDKGVLISHVAPNSPAQLAGLAVGDMIRRVGNARISNVAQFQASVEKAAIGQSLRLSVMRGGNPVEASVTLAARPAAPPQIPLIPPAKVTLSATWIGMDAAQLKPKDIVSLGLPQDMQGILVNEVEGQASMVGFQTGDVIVAVNGMATPDLDTFIQATRQQAGAAVEVVRANKHLFVSVPPPGYTP